MPAPIFGKYEVIKRLAVGGMGEVFLARQTGIPGFERHSILKSLLPDVAEQAGAIDEFLDEARVAATLNHPNVVSIYEVGLWEGIYYIAMEYIDGDNLSGLRKAALACGQFVPFEISARIIRDAADGLDHAHRAKDMTGKAMEIVHRDISPQNIMVRRDGVTKVVDFGIARAANRSTRTKTGMTKGKLAYMPPEQVRGQPVDGRSDQYALGVVLWELLTGKRLFQGDSDIDLMQLVLRGKIPKPTEIDPAVPAELEAITLQMLERDANSRYPTCHDVALSLSTWLDQVAPGLGTSEVSAFVVAAYDGSRALAEKPNKGNENFVIDLQGSGSGPIAAGPALTGPHNSQVAIAAAGGHGTPPAAQESVTTVKPRIAPPGAGSAISNPPVPIELAPEASGAGKSKRWLVPVVAVGALLAVAGIVAVSSHPVPPPVIAPVVNVVKPPPPPEVVKVPEKVVAPTPPPPARVSLTSAPSGADVKLGGKILGTTPFATDQLAANTVVTLDIEKTGFQPEHRVVKPTPGSQIEISVQLERVRSHSKGSSGTPTGSTPNVTTTPGPGPTGPPQFGYLSVNTNPFTTVKIDGDVYGSTPLFKKKLAVGNHVVDMANDGANIHWTKTVVVKAEEVVKLTMP